MSNLIERVIILLAEGELYTDIDRVFCELKMLGTIPTDADIKRMIAMYSLGAKNRCIVCKIDMGICNPRQLCGKTYCVNACLG